MAFGHAKFENSETVFEHPKVIWFAPIEILSDQEMTTFLLGDNLEVLPEVGSRAMQNVLFMNELPFSKWTTIQKGIYEYTVITTLTELKVKILIWEYLACEIIWDR